MRIYFVVFLSILVFGIIGDLSPDKIANDRISASRVVLYRVPVAMALCHQEDQRTFYANLRDGSKIRRVLVLRGLYLQISSYINMETLRTM